MNYSGVLILTGPSGAGKTTVARRLAEASDERTVHLHTDDFYAAIKAGFVEPWLAQSADQNLTVSRAIAAAASAYAVGGYAVIVDGIVGPWFLDVYRQTARIGGFVLDYVVLRPALETARRRAASRADQPLADYPPNIFEQLADLGELERHALAVRSMTVGEVAETVRAGVAEGRFRLTV